MKTQKAKGVLLGLPCLYNTKKTVYDVLRAHTVAPTHKLISSDYDINTENLNFPYFARPCPKRPRHGFVDSRVVTSRTGLKKLLKEVKKCDSDGEIILGPYIPNVLYNSIYVSSGSLSIGKGNDGATGGKNSFCVPVAPTKFDNKFLKMSGIGKNESVYIEAVCKYSSGYKKAINIVQARGGPSIDAVSSDYIPKRITVKKIVKPHNDLLRWEKEAAAFKPGTVVYGNGHTLASHAAIHCILNNVTFISSKRPSIGDILEPQIKSKSKISRLDFKRGVEATINMCKTSTYDDMYRYFYYSLSVLHNWAYIKDSKNAGWILGSASVLFNKLCVSLVLGEHRHNNHSKQYISRDLVYVRAMRNSAGCFDEVKKACKSFYSEHWDGGFGGLPWATCAWYTYDLWSKISKSFNSSRMFLSDKEISNMVTSINRTTNLAHNNGWWFNKIAAKFDMTNIAKAPGLAALSVSNIFANIKYGVSEIKQPIKLKKAAKNNTPCNIDSQGRLMWLKYNEPYYSSNSKKYEVVLRLKVTGEYQKSKIINISEKEYRSQEKCSSRTAYRNLAPIAVNGEFKLPGCRVRSLGKVFGIK